MTDQALAPAKPILRRQGQEEQRLAQALLAMTLTMTAEGMDHVEVELLNWGGSGGGESTYQLQDIALGDALEIACGAQQPQTVFSGEITGVEERYGDGAPKLVLFAEDKLHRLARKRRSQVFEEQSIDDIIGTIASEAGLQADAQVSASAITVHQLDESDLALLRRLVRPFGVPLRLDGTTLRAKPPEPTGEPVPMDARDNATRVRVAVDLARQFATAKVGGYNVPADELVDASADRLTPAPQGRTAAQHLQDLGWPSETLVPWPVGLSSGHGSDLAKGALARHAGGFLRGDLVCEGDPRLKPGAEIKLDGVSPRLAGTYGVVSCVHRFDLERGYECYVQIARADWQP